MEEMASGDRAAALALVSAVPDPAKLRNTSGRPVIGISGRLDDAVTADGIAAAREAAPQTEWVVYREAGGDFWDDAADGWDREACDDALERLAMFFEHHLPGVMP
jgi:dienelactone hydrolase